LKTTRTVGTWEAENERKNERKKERKKERRKERKKKEGKKEIKKEAGKYGWWLTSIPMSRNKCSEFY